MNEVLQIHLLDIDNTSDLSILAKKLEMLAEPNAIACNNWPEYTKQLPVSSFRIARTANELLVLFTTEGLDELRAENTAEQSPVSQDSCVEAFIEPVPGGEYWNFELNSNGALNSSHRKERPAPVRLDAEQLAAVRRLAIKGENNAWKLLLAIPLEMLGLQNATEGYRLRANFYCTSSRSRNPYYLSWAPITTEKPDFHLPRFFGEAVFA